MDMITLNSGTAIKSTKIQAEISPVQAILEPTDIMWSVQKVQNSCSKNLQSIQLSELVFIALKSSIDFITVQDFTLAMISASFWTLATSRNGRICIGWIS